jgi:hypothetical protein
MYSQYGWSEMFLYKAQLLFESELDKKTNAKVLEALEREFEGVSIYLGIEERTTGKEYYETEVRPKYK